MYQYKRYPTPAIAIIDIDHHNSILNNFCAGICSCRCMFRSVDLKRMLNEDKNNDDIMSYNTHEDGLSSRSVYSLVSEDGSENAPCINHDEKLGLLILEGHDDDNTEAFDGSGTAQDDDCQFLTQ